MGTPKQPAWKYSFGEPCDPLISSLKLDDTNMIILKYTCFFVKHKVK